MNINTEDRFKNGLRGEEYNFLLKAYSHYGEFQNCIAQAVASYAQEDMNILELGTGIGPTLEAVITNLGEKRIQIVAVDMNADDLEIASQCISNDKRVSFVMANIFVLLPLLATSSFDVICSGWTLHNFTESQRGFLFSHIKRILKKDGLFVNGDRFAYNDPSKQEISINEQLQLYKEYLPHNLCEGWSHHILEDEEYKFLESEQLVYFPNGKFTYRKRNEGVFIATNE